jgi:tetratricopeptide (TPR) repeat protein
MTTYFAQAALLSGDLAQAAVQGQQALDVARELSMRTEEGDALRILGEIATAQGQFDRAEQTLTTSLSTLEKAGDEYKWARSQLSLARLYAAQEKSQEALEALDRCLSIFRRLDAALDLADARALQREIVTTQP